MNVSSAALTITPKVRADPTIVEPRIDAREGIPVITPTAVRVLVRSENDKRTDDLSDIRDIQ